MRFAFLCSICAKCTPRILCMPSNMNLMYQNCKLLRFDSIYNQDWEHAQYAFQVRWDEYNSNRKYGSYLQKQHENCLANLYATSYTVFLCIKCRKRTALTTLDWSIQLDSTYSHSQNICIRSRRKTDHFTQPSHNKREKNPKRKITIHRITENYNRFFYFWLRFFFNGRHSTIDSSLSL